MTRRFLTRGSLAEMGCDSPRCAHEHSVLFFNQRYYPRQGLNVKYDKATGALTLHCCVCEEPAAALLVAERAVR